MAHIFISYSHDDIDFARRLKKLLEREGFEIWMDESNIPASSHWSKEIEDGIEQCAAFIVIMSPGAEASTWVEREILFAENKDKPIVPLLYEGGIWARLAHIQAIPVQGGLRRKLPATIKNQLINILSQRSAVTTSSLPAVNVPDTQSFWKRVAIFSILLTVAIIAWYSLRPDVLEPIADFIEADASTPTPQLTPLPTPIRWPAPDENPYVEILQGRTAILMQEDRPNHFRQQSPLNDRATLISQDSVLRAVFHRRSFAIIDPITVIQFNSVMETGDHLELLLEDGKIYLEKGDWPQNPMVSVGAGELVVVPSGSSVSIAYDGATQETEVACFTGECSIIDTSGYQENIELRAGQQVNFLIENYDPNLPTTVIANTDYTRYSLLCGGDCGLESPPEIVIQYSGTLPAFNQTLLAQPNTPIRLTPTGPTPVPMITVKRDANIYAGPGTEFEVIGSVVGGSQYLTNGISAHLKFYRIDFDGQEGWIRVEDVEEAIAPSGQSSLPMIPVRTPKSAVTVTPTPTLTATSPPTQTATRTPTLTPTPECTLRTRMSIGAGGRTVLVPSASTHVRSEPGSSATIVETIPAGQTFDVLDGPECVEGMQWWEIEGFGVEGTWKGWIGEGIDDNYQIEPFETNGVLCLGADPPRLTPGETVRVKDQPPLANRVRKSPEVETGNTIGEIPPGRQVEVISGPVCDPDGLNWRWWYVNYNGLTGWTAEGQPGEYWLEPLP